MKTYWTFLKDFFRFITRNAKPVYFNAVDRIEPVNRNFGWNRGTPIDRFYINDFISLYANFIAGDTLEVGELRYSCFLDKTKIRKMSALIYGKNEVSTSEISADLTNISTFAGAKYDAFLCFQTYNFIYDYKKAIATSYSIINKNGYLFGSVGCISKISNYDNDNWGDYWRFTELSISLELKEIGFEIVVIKSYGNLLSAKSFLDGVVVEDFSNLELLKINDSDFPIVICFLAKKV